MLQMLGATAGKTGVSGECGFEVFVVFNCSRGWLYSRGDRRGIWTELLARKGCDLFGICGRNLFLDLRGSAGGAIKVVAYLICRRCLWQERVRVRPPPGTQSNFQLLHGREHERPLFRGVLSV
jgi:hypothetical protein